MRIEGSFFVAAINVRVFAVNFVSTAAFVSSQDSNSVASRQRKFTRCLDRPRNLRQALGFVAPHSLANDERLQSLNSCMQEKWQTDTMSNAKSFTRATFRNVAGRGQWPQ